MKKEDISSIIVWMIILGVAVALQFLVINPMFDAAKIGNMAVLYEILTVVGSIIVLAILIELMHMFGAKIGKYAIVSVNVLCFNFYKLEGKIKFRFKGFDGITGETIVAPKYNDEGKCISKPKSMVLLPNVLMALILVLTYVVFMLFTKNGVTQLVGILGLLVFITTACLLFFNFLPIKLDSRTDGYQLRLITKKENITAFNELLRVKSCEVSNTDPGETKIFEEITDYTATINMVSFYKLLEKEDYQGALKIIELNLSARDKLSVNNRIQFEAQKLFILLFTKQIEKAKKYYEEIIQEDKRTISNSNSMVCVRTYVLISAIIDESEGEVQYATSKVDSAFKKVEALRKPIEKKLYIESVKFVKELHPKWEPVVSNDKKEKDE